jgi:hypothetical protein
VPISCIDVAAVLVEFLQRAATSSMQTRRRAVRAASRASEQENNRVNRNACLDEVDVVLPGRIVDGGHWVEGEKCRVRTRSERKESVSPFPYSPTPRLGHPTSRPAPSAGGRSALRPRGSGPRPEVQAPPPSPRRRRPDCGILEGRRTQAGSHWHAHACRGQPAGATPSAQPLRPRRKGGSAVSAPPRPPTVAAGHATARWQWQPGVGPRPA